MISVVYVAGSSIGSLEVSRLRVGVIYSHMQQLSLLCLYTTGSVKAKVYFIHMKPNTIRLSVSGVLSLRQTCPYTTIGGRVIVGKGLLLSCGLLSGHLIILLIECIGISS